MQVQVLARSTNPLLKQDRQGSKPLVYDGPVNNLQRSLFKTRLLLIAVFLMGVGIALGLHKFIR
jgi:hypothetical protein